MIKTLFIFGTRPEAIKLAPVIKAFDSEPAFETRICSTGQHAEMLDQVLNFFDIRLHYNLSLMRPNQSPVLLLGRALEALDKVLKDCNPDLVVVQGDTTTVLAGSLATFHRKIPVAHVEAGLRSHDLQNPFPEEMNRKLASEIASYHFTPTEKATLNLASEGITGNVFKVGNTVVDALQLALQNLKGKDIELNEKFELLGKDRAIILLTCHRRESFGAPFEGICRAIQQIALNHPHMDIVFPVHKNPNIREVAHQLLTEENIHLLEPLDYPELIWILSKSELVLTDSGGIQEEAPSLGIPVLVLRKVTERTEGIEAGTARLVGTTQGDIIDSVKEVLGDRKLYTQMSQAINPYGDGKASLRIRDIIKRELKR